MKKQLRIGFVAVFILLILESARALAGTLDQIEIRIVTQERSLETEENVNILSSRVMKQPASPTASRAPALEPTQAQIPLITSQPTSTGQRPELVPSSTPQVTFTPAPTQKPARKKTPVPSAGISTDNPTSAPEVTQTEVVEPSPTNAPTGEPFPTSAPFIPPTNAPTEETGSLPTLAPTPGG